MKLHGRTSGAEHGFVRDWHCSLRLPCTHCESGDLGAPGHLFTELEKTDDTLAYLSHPWWGLRVYNEVQYFLQPVVSRLPDSLKDSVVSTRTYNV
jgi:hypothetical protein